MKHKLTFICLIIFVTECLANNKFNLNDFAIPLEQITSGETHIWVNSGYTTVNPEHLTVLGVKEFYSPPFAAKNFRFKTNIVINADTIADTGSYGKGDVGLIYAGGTWYPQKIVRRGTYHHLKKEGLVSVNVTSELIPLFGQSGFIEKINITNRTNSSMDIELIADIQAGIPSVIPLKNWGFGVPRANVSETKQFSNNIWATDHAKIVFLKENTKFILLPNETSTTYFTILINKTEEKMPDNLRARELESNSVQAWENRLATYTKNIPSLESNIKGLKDYYKRSVISGLVCIWENPSFILNPFLTTCGMDGGGVCAYLWDIAGYVPKMATLMLDSSITNIAKIMSGIDLERYYAYTPDGSGVGVKYSYSPWSFTRLVSTIFKIIGPDEKLFFSAKKLVLNNEKQQADNNLIDYGVQNNLLEMRGTGWEHYVASPNAERSWCLNQLAEMGIIINHNQKELNNWKKQADIITRAIQRELWDNEVKWFASIYPNGFKNFVYTIQVYDALRSGACTLEMEKVLISHLKDGAFLGKYGITSISKKDSIHYEVLDTDWSGGGAYTGDGPELASIMYERNRPELAWDILKRHFWMGKHLIYFPQEHFANKPMSPQHKRSNEVSGLAGAQAILFGLIGFQPQYNGKLLINPQPVDDGEIKIKGFGFKNNKFDIDLSKDKMKILKNDSLIYEGEPKKIKVL
jgi:hypothetical protein